MKLKLLSLQNKEIIENIEWIEINTERGNYVIQKNHIAGIFILTANKPLLYLHTTLQKTVAIQHGGILEFANNCATVLLFNQS